MCKNVTFAQGLKVLVPKQQWLVSECVKLTMDDAMHAKQQEKYIYILKDDTNLEKPKR